MTRRSEHERTALVGLRRRAILLGAPSELRLAAKRVRTAGVRPVGAIVAGDIEAASVAGLPLLASKAAWLRGEFDEALTAAKANLLIVVTRPSSREAARAVLHGAVKHHWDVEIADLSGETFALRPMTLEDVIGPPLGAMDWERVREAIAGKRVLVTGGAGSIGGELVRRLTRLGPAHVAVLDNSEFNLFSIEQELSASASILSFRYCDVRDGESIRRAFAAARPDIVFHAAAMKHVPIVEQNACEGVLTNVLGARNVFDAAEEAGAHLVFVSTDKAANPVSVMGATKRLMELHCQAMDRTVGGPRRLVARLGNVLGSAGSVAPLFERQIAAGGPITVTDRDVARFFISIGQAAEFLLEAAAVGLRRDMPRGVALVLDMGDPVRVEELAQDMIRLKGLEPGRDIAIRHVGLRAGEKLREELIADDEAATPTASPGVRAAASPPVTLPDMARRLERIIAAARTGSDSAVRRLIHEEVILPARIRAVG